MRADGVGPVISIETRARVVLRPLTDVGRPVAVCAGLLVGMVGNDPRFHLQAGGIRGPQQHGLDPQLRHKNLHVGVRVADLQHTLDPKPPAQIINPPVARGHQQR